jgi:hypothetical protein
MDLSKLQKRWIDAQVDLNLEIVLPYEFLLEDGSLIAVELLLKNFGAKNGMLILTDYKLIRPHLSWISDCQYGFSVLDVPKNEIDARYDRTLTIEILRDWGWSGPSSLKPSWIGDENGAGSQLSG